jgi:uncharacterized protein YyaL (SSP411 family)
VLVRMGALLGRSDLTQKAEQLFASTGAMLGQYPSGFGRMLEAIDFYLGHHVKIAIIGADKAAHQFISAYRRRFLPRTVIAAGEAGTIELLRGRTRVNGNSAAYICENMSCRQPVTDLSEFESQLA